MCFNNFNACRDYSEPSVDSCNVFNSRIRTMCSLPSARHQFRYIVYIHEINELQPKVIVKPITRNNLDCITRSRTIQSEGHLAAIVVDDKKQLRLEVHENVVTRLSTQKFPLEVNDGSGYKILLGSVHIKNLTECQYLTLVEIHNIFIRCRKDFDW